MKTIIIVLAAAGFAPACRGEAVDQREAYKPVEDPAAATGAPAADPWKPDPWKPEGRAAPVTETAPMPPAATGEPAPSTAVDPEDTTTAGVDKDGVVTNAEPQDVDNDDVTYVEIRTHFSDHARERLARIDARLRDLENRIDVRSKAATQELRTRRDALASDVDRIGDQAKDGWAKFRSRVQTSVEEMERDLDAAMR